MITVLLSAYNGEKYIREQLNSILAQEEVECKVLVRDDGSSDRTKEILEEYSAMGVSWYSGKNIGWAKSFMDLVRTASESDYYAFSDQDDVWFSNKLSAGISLLESKPDSGPKLYFCNQFCWRNGEIVGKVHSIEPSFNKYDCMVKNPTFGCTMVFNKALMDIVRNNFPVYLTSHDYFFYQVAMTVGEVYYDHEAYMKYRLHDNNQSGASESRRKIWLKRYKSFKKIWNDHDREFMAQELLRSYGHLMDDKTRKIVETPAYYRKSMNNYLRFLFSNRYIFHKFSIDFWLKMRILICHF